MVDETLTADTSGIADADGLTNVSYSYQWIAGDTDISDATDSTCTLVSTDEGKTIKVRVSFTDDANNQETLTSAATAAVAARPNSPATGLPTISGTAQVDETLTADTSGIADADGLTNATFSYQWLSSRDTEIQGANASTYTLVSADEGKTIKVRVSFTDDANNQETLTSDGGGGRSARRAAQGQPGEHAYVPRRHRLIHLGTPVQRGGQAELQDPAGARLHGHRGYGEEVQAAGAGQQHPLADNGETGVQRRRDHSPARHHRLRRPGGHLHEGQRAAAVQPAGVHRHWAVGGKHRGNHHEQAGFQDAAAAQCNEHRRR